MTTVNVVSVSSGKVLGTMTLGDANVTTSDQSTQRLFDSIKKAFDGDVTDAEIMDLFAGGWSNGYVKTVEAVSA